jgi:hypothetical protein
MIEYHGRLSVSSAIDMINRLERYHPTWSEEPVTPDSIDLLAEVKKRVNCPIAAGERLYTLPDFFRLISFRAADVVQNGHSSLWRYIHEQKDRCYCCCSRHARLTSLFYRTSRIGRSSSFRR